MSTPEQFAANLAGTVRAVRSRLKLPPAGAVPRDRLGEYMRVLSAEILADPGSYTAQAVENARRYLAAPDAAPLESFGLGDAATVFAGEVARQAVNIGEGAAAVGSGVVNTAKLTRYLIPVAVVLAIYLFITRRVSPPAP